MKLNWCTLMESVGYNFIGGDYNRLQNSQFHWLIRCSLSQRPVSIRDRPSTSSKMTRPCQTVDVHTDAHTLAAIPTCLIYNCPCIKALTRVIDISVASVSFVMLMKSQIYELDGIMSGWYGNGMVL